MPRDHHDHVNALLYELNQVVGDHPELEPIEVTAAAILLALSTAHQHSRIPPDIAVKELLDSLYSVYIKDN